MKSRLVIAVVCFLGGAAVMHAQTRDPGATVVGDNAQAVDGDGVAVGRGATTTSHATVAKGCGRETVAIGAGARAEGWRCTALGAGAKAGVVSATALGRATYAWGAHMIAIGRGAHMEKVERSPDLALQNACGIAGDSLWLGGLMCHKYIDRTGDSYVHEPQDGGDGKARWDVRTEKPADYTIHGMDAYDARFDQDPKRFNAAQYDPNDKATWTHRVDKDVAGGSLNVAAGRGTGMAAGGAVNIQTAPAGKVSQNRKNPLKTGLRVDADYSAADATPMLLWDNNANRLKRVKVGPPDSGGKGFRALVIEN